MTAARKAQPHPHAMRALYRYESAIVHGEDDDRAAALGRQQELPSLGEALMEWAERIKLDAPQDFTQPFQQLSLTPSGRISRGAGGMPMTYKVFGSILRNWTKAPRNVAAVLCELPTKEASPPIDGADEKEHPHSVRACAFNAYLARYKGAGQLVLRTRLMHVGEKVQRTAIAAVTTKHSLESSDDDKLILALAHAFAGAHPTARAQAYRGIDQSEIRIILPAVQVTLAGDAGTETWIGYVTARNSETGAASWTISAGLYRQHDGATLACEAMGRGGRHTGRKVADRMVDAAHEASAMLQRLISEAAELAASTAPWTEAETLKRLGLALKGTDEDVLCGIAFDLGLRGGPIAAGAVVSAIARLAAAEARRGDALPLEILAGRVLMRGWHDLHAVEKAAEE